MTPNNKNNSMGKVYLIGAGPGDEGLLTLKGADCLSRTEVVVYDYLSNDSLLAKAPPESEKIYVGKKASQHALPQEEINDLLVRKALQGKSVSRLKGGDPYVFGRGGEEALALSNAGIEFEVIPGVTAGIAAAAYAGIPFTHRGITTTAAFITGHEMDGKNQSGINWQSLAGIGTLVFYMGVKTLPFIVKNLLQAGRPGSTPAAIVQWGTMPYQNSATGTLDSIVGIAQQKSISAPALIIVGEVVQLRNRLNWFEKKPLFGRKIIVTRSRSQASGLSSQLRELGAEVIEFPTIEIRTLPGGSNLSGIFESISEYSWIIFTSVNSADIFLQKIMEQSDVRILSGIKIAAIGMETARRFTKYGLQADLIPEQCTSEGMIESLKNNEKLEGRKILIPGSLIARDLLPQSLSELGALVDTVPLYENRIPQYTGEHIDNIFNKKPDLWTFTSSSTVLHLIEILEKNKRKKYIKNINGVSIGPITSASAQKTGINVLLEAEEQTIPALISKILKFTTKKEEK